MDAPTSMALTDAMGCALENVGQVVCTGVGWSVDRVIGPGPKRELGATGALTVDTESYAALGSAAARGVPAAVLRVVADPLPRGIPASLNALAWVEGGPWWPAIFNLWRLPFETADIRQFRHDLRHGLHGLRGVLPIALDALAEINV